jgi:hypothetical protein
MKGIEYKTYKVNNVSLYGKGETTPKDESVAILEKIGFNPRERISWGFYNHINPLPNRNFLLHYTGIDECDKGLKGTFILSELGLDGIERIVDLGRVNSKSDFSFYGIGEKYGEWSIHCQRS